MSVFQYLYTTIVGIPQNKCQLFVIGYISDYCKYVCVVFILCEWIYSAEMFSNSFRFRIRQIWHYCWRVLQTCICYKRFFLNQHGYCCIHFGNPTILRTIIVFIPSGFLAVFYFLYIWYFINYYYIWNNFVFFFNSSSYVGY